MNLDSSFGKQSDEDIIEAARIGDERAWDHIFETLHRPLLGFFRLRGAADPENLLGETFLRLARNMHRFRGNLAGLKAYAMTVAANLLRDQARRNATRPRLAFFSPSDIETFYPGPPADESTDTNPVSLDLGSKLQQLLNELTPDQRDVLYLRFVGDLSVAQTAKVLGRSTGAIKQLQHRAIENLRHALRGAPEDARGNKLL